VNVLGLRKKVPPTSFTLQGVLRGDLVSGDRVQKGVTSRERKVKLLKGDGFVSEDGGGGNWERGWWGGASEVYKEKGRP